MQNLPEGVIYVIVLAVAYLATYLLKRFGPTMGPEPLQAEPDAEPTAQAPGGVAAASTTATLASLGPQAALVKAMRPSQSRRQPRLLALLGSKRNKQAAIAMAAVLGPCRAFVADLDSASPRR